jgi:hypothetical protein
MHEGRMHMFRLKGHEIVVHAMYGFMHFVSLIIILFIGHHSNGGFWNSRMMWIVS